MLWYTWLDGSTTTTDPLSSKPIAWLRRGSRGLLPHDDVEKRRAINIATALSTPNPITPPTEAPAIADALNAGELADPCPADGVKVTAGGPGADSLGLMLGPWVRRQFGARDGMAVGLCSTGLLDVGLDEDGRDELGELDGCAVEGEPVGAREGALGEGAFEGCPCDGAVDGARLEGLVLGLKGVGAGVHSTDWQLLRVPAGRQTQRVHVEVRGP